MLGVKLICVGKMKFYDRVADEYIKRLSGMVKVETLEIPEQRLTANPSDAEIRNALTREAVQILRAIPDRAYAVAMCIEGKMLTSTQFAESLFELPTKGVSLICIIIGGSHGLCDTVKNRADLRLSMSAMTFPHHLARVMLLEQIYRAAAINAGSKYHK